MFTFGLKPFIYLVIIIKEVLVELIGRKTYLIILVSMLKVCIILTTKEYGLIHLQFGFIYFL